MAPTNGRQPTGASRANRRQPGGQPREANPTGANREANLMNGRCGRQRVANGRQRANGDTQPYAPTVCANGMCANGDTQPYGDGQRGHPTL